MRALIFLTSTVLALPPGVCIAQSHSHSPYAGFEARSIKALSDQQMSDLRAGLGMSLALAAELNGYPGPRHTLELADELGLSAAQRAKVEELFATMKAESIPIGERLIAQEAELDKQFAQKTITVSDLVASTQAIGDTQAGVARNSPEISPADARGTDARANATLSRASGLCRRGKARRGPQVDALTSYC